MLIERTCSRDHRRRPPARGGPRRGRAPAPPRLAVSLHHIPGGGVPTVGSNHREVGRLCTEHLLALGHRCVGTVTGPFRRLVVRSRLRGYEEALRSAGLEPLDDMVVEGDWPRTEPPPPPSCSWNATPA